MNLPLIIHSIYILGTLFVASFWLSVPALSPYTIHLVAFFVLVYLASYLWQRHSNKKIPFLLSIINSVVFLLIVLLLVLSTGGLNSPLFFLIYFVLFALSLAWEPTITIVFSLGLIIFFLYAHPQLTMQELITLTSLIFITPLSLFFGQQYVKTLEQSGQIKTLSTKVKKHSKDITEEETNILLWLSLNFKHSMEKVVDLLSQSLERSTLSFNQKSSLKEALRLAKKLLQTGNLLKQKIDHQTD